MEKEPVKISKLKTLAIIASAMVCAQSAQAGTWSLGAAALVSPDAYRGYQDRVYPVPVIDYEGDDFYFRSDRRLLPVEGSRKPAEHHGLPPWGYRPGDSDDDRMKRLDKRRAR